MRKKWTIVAFVSVVVIFGYNLRSIADCKSDCRETYESEVESCKDTYDDPDDAGMLQTCIDDATSQYQSCIDECENEVGESVSISEFQPITLK